MRPLRVLPIVIAVLLALAACGGSTAAPPEPTAAQVSEAEPEATTIPIEPTQAPATPAPSPTIEPTATAVPPTATVEPTPTKIPPPEISLETITGMITQFDDQAGGYNWILFGVDGTFVARHGPAFDTGVPVADGTFALDGDVMTLFIPDGCPDGERYQLRYATETQIHFEGIDSTCDYFVDDFRRLPNWRHIEP